jgi:hypothetical protein
MISTAFCISLLPYTVLTHPGYAALADPLFAFGGKRVKKKKYPPLFTLA